MKTVICFSTVDWDGLWHAPQALMSRFARDGYDVLYVDTIGARSPKPRDLGRIASRLRNRMRASRSGVRMTADGVRVYSPVLLPFLDNRIARRLNVSILLRALRRLVGRTAADDLIVWVYLPTWTVLQCVRRLSYRALVYSVIDAGDQSPHGVSRDYVAAEREILRRADLVFTSSETLRRDKEAHNPRTHCIAPAVSSAWLEDVEPAEDVKSLPGKRIGFFGMLDHRIDVGLLTSLAETHPEWSFVLIGDARADVSALVAKPNVHCLGVKPHAELPRHLAGLDVFVLPYVVDGFTRHIQPAKLFECFAFGKPVVATRLPALEPLSDVVQLVRGFDAFDRALRSAVAETRTDLRERRRALAGANSWNVRYKEICAYLDGRTGT